MHHRPAWLVGNDRASMLETWNPFNEHTGEYALLIVALLTVAHLASPWVRDRLRAHTPALVSFGGGVAIAYVFVHLIPDLEAGHEYIGDRIHVLALAGFLLFYTIELQIARRMTSDGETRGGGEFWLVIAISWVYTWLIIVALPAAITTGFLFALLGGLAIGLHVLYKGYVLHLHHREAFASRGRYVLAFAPLAGWLTHVLLQPSEVVFDVVLALLAGFLMQSVFREELPSLSTARLRWFVAGAVIFLLLVLITP
jgi:hypothetical protein